MGRCSFTARQVRAVIFLLRSVSLKLDRYIMKLFLMLKTLLALGLFAASIPAVWGQGDKYSETQVSFRNGETEIAASLYLPQKVEPFSAVVIVHGSGNSDRSNAWTLAYAKALAKRGIAVLYPDKRGAGASKGDWKTASFSDLAGDAIAGVELLRNDKRIDKAKIGLIGFSQGGHTIPLAASLSPQIAFSISISGSTVPILEQIADEIEMSAERAVLNPEQIITVREINQRALNYALTGKGWDEYKNLLDNAKNGSLKGHKIVEGFPATADHWFAQHIRTIGNYDPMLYWAKLSHPVLFVYGGQDTNIRVSKSISRIEKRLDPGKLDYTLMLFHKNGHTLFRDDLLDFMVRWIRDGN